MREMRRLYWRLLIEFRSVMRQLSRMIKQGFWLTMGDILFQIPVYRDAYYAYREHQWHSAKDAKAFAYWLEEGNLFFPGRKTDG